MSKPAFDPNKPFNTEKPPFDPNKPLDSMPDSGGVSGAEALGSGVAQGASAGYIPQIVGGATAGINALKDYINPQSDLKGGTIPRMGYTEARDATIANLNAQKSQHPLLYGGGEIAGGVAPAIASGTATTGMGPIAGLSTQGAILGGLSNPGDAKGKISPVQPLQRGLLALLGAGIGGSAASLREAPNAAKWGIKKTGQMAAGMTPTQAETFAKNPELVRQILGEYQDDPAALMRRGKELGTSAMAEADSVVSDLSDQRNAARANKTIQIAPGQYKGTVVEQELDRIARTDPRNTRPIEGDPDLINNAGEPIKPTTSQYVPPQSMTIGASKGGELASAMGNNAGFNNQWLGMQPEAKAAQDANRAGWSNIRQAVGGAVPGENEMNDLIADQAKASKTLGKMINSNSSKALTDQSIKARALAQVLSPEMYDAKKATDAAMTMLPSEGEGLTKGITKALGQRAIQFAGPAVKQTSSPQTLLAPNLQAILTTLKEQKE